MKILAVDLGDAHTGLACCDRTETLASPIGVIHDRSMESTLRKVAAAVIEYEAKQVVVGYPKNMNNTVGERAEKCARFADALARVVDVPVQLWDERGTTVSAYRYFNESGTPSKKRKELVDAAAAAIILENYLNYRQNSAEG